MITVMRKQKDLFLRAVWERVRNTGSHVMDTVIEVAELQNLEIETAAKIVKGDAELQALLKQQAIDLRLLPATEDAV